MKLIRLRPFKFAYGGLFWRTFLLIALLIIVSLGAWFQSFRVIEREPHAQRVALQLTSIIKLTRAALLYADPALRRALLQDLESNEGIRVFLRRPNDIYSAPANTLLNRSIEKELHKRLGKLTIFASNVNQAPGIWISFNIDNDKYWVALSADRLNNVTGWQWLGWGSFALILSIVGAALITNIVNRPFSQLAEAAREVGLGNVPNPLPEHGLGVAANTNRSFNQMVRDLENIETDRKLMLAGISHDLRTPLARLRLETEMTAMSDDTRLAMVNDIEQMNSIIGRFLDYARPAVGQIINVIDLSKVINETLYRFKNNACLVISKQLEEPIWANINATDVIRIVTNIIDNSIKYGKTCHDSSLQSLPHPLLHSQSDPLNNLLTDPLSDPLSDPLTDSVSIDSVSVTYLNIDLKCHDRYIYLTIRDYGPGISARHLPYITRPFYRVDNARSTHDGIGLGMAIVQRLIRRHGGELIIQNHNPPPGLELIIKFAAATPAME